MGSRSRAQAEERISFVEVKSVSTVTPDSLSPTQHISDSLDGGFFAWLQVLACVFVLMNTWYAI